MPPEKVPDNTPLDSTQGNPSTQPTPPAPPKAPGLKQIRTYQGDIADAIRSQQESLVSIQRQERARAVPVESASDGGERRKAIFLLIGSFVLVILGIAGGWYSYREYATKTALPVIDTPANRFIRVKDMINLTASSTRSEIILTLAERATEKLESGETRQIQFIKKVGETTALVSTQEFFKTLDTRAPGSLTRALDPLFMVGVIGTGPPSTFIFIKLESFENAFPGMLMWEKNMVEDIGPLFSTRANIANVLPEATFEDVVIKNKDVRLINDAAGEPVLLYSFINQETLVITDNVEALRLLLSRLESEKLSR